MAKQSLVVRLLYGRHPDHFEDPAPFYADALKIGVGFFLFVVAVSVPKVGMPVFLLYLAWLVVPPLLRYRARRAARPRTSR